MSRVTLSPGIDIWRGKVSGKSSMIMRIKSYRDDSGHIIKTGPQEYYSKERRDYKRSPLTADEEIQRKKWQEVCREASQIIKDKNHPRYSELRSRWNAQFTEGPDASLNKGCEKKKIYGMFPVFVRMVIMKEKKSQE